MNRRATPLPICDCGQGKPYEACCAPLHAGAPALSAEALMRSRYSAYARGLERYLLDTWHSSTRPAVLGLQHDATTRWLGLKILHHAQTSEHAATVSFIARYRIGGGSAQRMQETSRFLRENARWYYVDGEVTTG